jgi:hypothetical protein
LRKTILIIVAALVIPAALYLGWSYIPVRSQAQVSKMLAHANASFFDTILSRIDRIATTASIIIGALVASKELHTTRKKKRKAKE